MSAVSSMDAGQGLYQFIQQLGAGSATTAAAPASATDATSSATATDSSQTTQATGGGHHHHGHGAMFGKIESAVTSALQSAQADGDSDPNKVIEDAIAKVFQNSANGSTGAGTQRAGGSDPDGDGDTDAPGATDIDAGSAKQAFLQTLQSLGVDPQQFHADFVAAIKDAQNGQVDPAAALKSFPPGSNVDTLG